MSACVGVGNRDCEPHSTVRRVVPRRSDGVVLVACLPLWYGRLELDSPEVLGDAEQPITGIIGTGYPMVSLIAALVAVTAASAVSPLQGGEKIVALDLKATEVPAGLVDNLTEVFVATLRETAEKSNVLGQADIEAMLAAEELKSLLGCSDGTCLAEIGGALGADLFASGSIGKVGSLYLVSLRLISTAKTEAVSHVSERVAADEESLVEAVSQLAAHLVDPARAIRMGKLDVRVQGALTIDGQAAGTGPGLRMLAAGQHRVVVTDGQGKAFFDEDIQVPLYGTVLVGVTDLTPAVAGAQQVGLRVQAASPWYQHWWVWAGIGAVVVAGAAATVYLLGGDDSEQTTDGTIRMGFSL